MLRLPNFWEDEFKQPLLSMDQGYIKEQGIDALVERAAKWKEYLRMSKEEIVKIEYGTQEPDRIFILDAERTFHNEDSKKKLVRILNYISKSHSHSHNHTSYTNGQEIEYICQEDEERKEEKKEFKEEEEEAEEYWRLSTSMLLPGFWRAEAVSFGTEAQTFFKILDKVHPAVTKHLQENLIEAGTICQRWFLGLCVHCLPFQELFRYFDEFFKGGRNFLLSFGLALCGILEKEILATKNTDTIFALLRLDKSVIKDNAVFGRILDDVPSYRDRLKNFDLDILRAESYEIIVKPRLAAAQKAREAVVIIDDCQWCLDNLPEAYCIECAAVVCQDCLDIDQDERGHKESHKVISMEEYEDRLDEFTAAAASDKKEESTPEELTEKISNLSI
ncbi:RabGAP/TBC domain-containing protein [Cavenderia fasciculata]|uniref:RabGAP/TBC domain-containing protein n=1 Tax=Cavenderia fasciculata TaxID=261658 RepID=F4PT52_CACFS|nr:RabGAP/TBC domain-containing protein [Cavenderia fasciculata]EGG21628.1 RabGAP/TBC domain-containing protein [Cavenderia fasciculata]|eukprot:XP_004359478.1 RabGAP/TBC domain-containing protein [Cavenderia fasciculata]